MAEGKGTLTNIRDSAKARIKRTVKQLYFPEMWYTVENYFQDAREKAVLDVGSGNGLITEAFAKSGWEVTAIDPSLTCLRLAQKRYVMAGLEGRFEQCDPEKLPFADKTFDYVTCINLLEFTPSPDRVVAEIFRVLRPGGKAVIATFNRRSPWGIGSVARIVRRDYGKRIPRFLARDELVALIKEAGLGLDTLTMKAKYLPTATRMTRLRLPVSGCYVALVYRRREPAGPDETVPRGDKNYILE